MVQLFIHLGFNYPINRFINDEISVLFVEFYYYYFQIYYRDYDRDGKAKQQFLKLIILFY
jgi:hypothetical protein